MERVTMPRRHMRRPVAGGLPYSRPLPIVEERVQIPNVVWFGIGFVTTALAMAAAGYALLAWWFDRTFN